MMALVVAASVGFGLLVTLGVLELDAWYRRRKWRKRRKRRCGYVDVRSEGNGELG